MWPFTAPFSTSFLFVVRQFPSAWIYYIHLSIHQLVNTWVFPTLAIKNNITMNLMYTHFSTVFISLGIHLECEIGGLYGNSSFYGTARLFSIFHSY